MVFKPQKLMDGTHVRAPRNSQVPIRTAMMGEDTQRSRGGNGKADGLSRAEPTELHRDTCR